MKKKIFAGVLAIASLLTAAARNEERQVVVNGEIPVSRKGNNNGGNGGENNKSAESSGEVKSKKKLVKVSEEQDIYYRESEKNSRERFGSEYVGFIDLPKWEDVKWLIDIYSDTYTLEISRDGVDIYTLDSFDIKNTQGLSSEETAKNLVEQEFRKYLNEGHSRSNLEIKLVEASGYKGVQLRVKELSGKTLIKNVFAVGNKVYYANAQGISKNINEMEKHILTTWNPHK